MAATPEATRQTKRLKRDVIHRDSPEEIERKKREKDEEEHKKMLESEEYKKKVEDDMADAVARLDGVEGIAMVPFGIGDVVRHPVVGRIVQAYEGPDA